MFVLTESSSERAAVLSLVAASPVDWSRVAWLIEQAGSALSIINETWSPFDPEDKHLLQRLLTSQPTQYLESNTRLINTLEQRGIRLVTILDHDYPANLRAIYNKPPMLFLKGTLVAEDERAVAVVGTRRASPEGLRQAHRLAYELARRKVTVLSGLAAGIDTAAHRGALAAGGRTVAVLGTGINRIYPPGNEQLAEEITQVGALVSQFWPDSPPTRFSFPMRNVVMSGMSVGTAVIEASGTSGARLQARLALEHGKRVFLVESLVLSQPWARAYAARAGVTVVRSVDEIVATVDEEENPPQQLSFG